MKKLTILLSVTLVFVGIGLAESDDAPFRVNSEARAKLLQYRARVIFEGRAKDRYAPAGDPESKALSRNIFSNNNCGVDIGNTFGDIGSGKLFGQTQPTTIIIDGDIINAYNRCTR